MIAIIKRFSSTGHKSNLLISWSPWDSVVHHELECLSCLQISECQESGSLTSTAFFLVLGNIPPQGGSRVFHGLSDMLHLSLKSFLLMYVLNTKWSHSLRGIDTCTYVTVIHLTSSSPLLPCPPSPGTSSPRCEGAVFSGRDLNWTLAWKWAPGTTEHSKVRVSVSYIRAKDS